MQAKSNKQTDNSKGTPTNPQSSSSNDHFMLSFNRQKNNVEIEKQVTAHMKKLSESFEKQEGVNINLDEFIALEKLIQDADINHSNEEAGLKFEIFNRPKDSMATLANESFQFNSTRVHVEQVNCEPVVMSIEV